mmetsp:Transcript_13331/g.42298  ORF Transcript_13331/g.42298 Transcript_13331/m.42298 type:complete len:300 (-) Transcript_13331:4135-5034(-)
MGARAATSVWCSRGHLEGLRGDLGGLALGGALLRGRHELPELRDVLAPAVEDALPLGRARLGHVHADELLKLLLRRLGADPLHCHNLAVDFGREGAVLVEEIPDAARHARGHVAADGAEHNHRAAGHILAAVVAHALHDRHGQRVAHGESLARAPVDEQHAAGGAVQARVTSEGAVLWLSPKVRGRADGDHAPAHALAHAIVGLPDERHLHPADGEDAEALARGALEREGHLAGEAVVSVLEGNLPRHAAARRAVDINDLELLGDARLVRDGRQHLGVREDLVVEHVTVGVHRLRDALG